MPDIDGRTVGKEGLRTAYLGGWLVNGLYFVIFHTLCWYIPKQVKPRRETLPIIKIAYFLLHVYLKKQPVKNFAWIALIFLSMFWSWGLAQSPNALDSRKVQDYFQDVESKSYYQQEHYPLDEGGDERIFGTPSWIAGKVS